MENLKSALKSKDFDREVFFGYFGFYVVNGCELDDIELGYSKSSNGDSLIGENDGDWLSNWIVIGTDTEIGDPFFVDITDSKLPVYTAMHGTGSWEAELISKSLSGFIQALNFLQSTYHQEFALIEPEATTVTDSDILSSIEKKLSEFTGNSDHWENLFEQYTEWLEEIGS
jgi:hypothetical protein